MRKNILVFLLALLLSSFLFAAEEVPRIFTEEELEEVEYNPEDFKNEEERQLYWFLNLYNLMLQGKGQGGLIAISDKGDYVAGYSIPGTPEDFFSNLPPSTLAVPYAAPIDFAMALYSSLNNLESYNSLIKYKNDGLEYVGLIAVMKLYEPVVSENASYSVIRQAIEKSASASGLDREPFYQIFEQNGISQVDLVNMVASGSYSPNDISLMAIRLIKELNKEKGLLETLLPLFVGAACAVAIVILVLFIILILSAKRGKKKKSEEEL